MKENLGTVYFLKMGGVDGILIVPYTPLLFLIMC